MPKLLPVAAVVAVDAVLAAVATYAVLRTNDALFNREPNPATVIWTAHIAVFWRLGIGLYVGGMAAIVACILVPRNLALSVRVTAAMVPVVGAMIALQGALFP